jgi:hypothetical protein
MAEWDFAVSAKGTGAGPPLRWDEERRFLLRCELDATFFHLYLPIGGGKPERKTGTGAENRDAGPS